MKDPSKPAAATAVHVYFSLLIFSARIFSLIKICTEDSLEKNEGVNYYKTALIFLKNYLGLSFYLLIFQMYHGNIHMKHY